MCHCIYTTAAYRDDLRRHHLRPMVAVRESYLQRAHRKAEQVFTQDEPSKPPKETINIISLILSGKGAVTVVTADDADALTI